MCDYCKENYLNLLIESTKIDDHLIGLDEAMLATTLFNFIDDNSVVIDIRSCGAYIRLGDRDDMQCLDHEEKIHINFCPMCGRKLGGE